MSPNATIPSNAQPPRVCIVMRDLGQPSEVWMLRQARLLRGVQPTIVCWNVVGDADRTAPVPVERVHTPAAPMPDRWRRARALARTLTGSSPFEGARSERAALRAIFERTGASAALAHFGAAALRILPAARDLGVPVIAHFHGLDVSSQLRDRWYRIALRRNIRRFAGMVIVGEHQRQVLLAYGADPSRIRLIPCGAPTNVFTPAPEPPRRSDPVGIIVARLIPTKGHDAAIHALAGAAERGVLACLRIVGDGPLAGMLKDLASRLGVASRVEFMGVRTPEEVLAQLRDADFALQPSCPDGSGWVEGFGVAVTEAAACGLPVIGTRFGGIPDQIVDGRTGLLVPPGDTAALTDAIALLASDHELRLRLGAAARERAVEHFDSAILAGRLSEFILETVHHASGAHANNAHA
ncbi:MAG: glycosyltransferase [Phycisphaerales bacterium]|jgi:glycosyltransferase involved in cell wall biosynthesis|nr:glycosyltransferase [Phycisphaerales bacterium]